MNIISYAIGLNSSGGGSGGGGDAPTAEELTFTGNDLDNRRFSGKLADIVCSYYLDKISFNDITSISYSLKKCNNFKSKRCPKKKKKPHLWKIHLQLPPPMSRNL